MFPCPHCPRSFNEDSELLNHALREHSVKAVSRIIGRGRGGGGHVRALGRADFTQVDSHWIYAIGGFHLSIAPDPNGDFKLMVYGSIEPIPAATQYPSQPEWDKALDLANKFLRAYVAAVEKE